MIHIFHKATILIFSLFVLFIHCLGAETKESSIPISYKDIGPKYHIEGRFGPLYQEFTIKGIVVEPPSKRHKELHNNYIWINITHVNGKALNSIFLSEMVNSDSNFIAGKEVELVLIEEGKLISGDSIDLILSNPNKPIHGKMVCLLSLHQKRIVSGAP